MREHQEIFLPDTFNRYTLTYSEGTWPPAGGHPWLTIYPHIQWGNYFSLVSTDSPADTPSHTVREQNIFSSDSVNKRYTLTYSEGTILHKSGFSWYTIYPHIQWGNKLNISFFSARIDTPSRIVRERKHNQDVPMWFRYTLTYSEGTLCCSSRDAISSIHPHIQWGNSSFVTGR